MNVPDPTPPVITAAGTTLRRLTGRQRIWSALRVLKQFDIPNLIRASECPEKAVRTYVDALLRANYLRRVSVGNSRLGTWTIYGLARKVGRIAPSINHRRRSDGTVEMILTDRNADGGCYDISLSRRAARNASNGKASGELVDGGVG